MEDCLCSNGNGRTLRWKKPAFKIELVDEFIWGGASNITGKLMVLVAGAPAADTVWTLKFLVWFSTIKIPIREIMLENNVNLTLGPHPKT